jgi:hypothetical protein
MNIFIMGGVPNRPLPCYKCGQLVLPNNSVLHFENERLKDRTIFEQLEWRDTDCHLLPVDGAMPCIGSPSRYQLLEGFPPDTRPEYKNQVENTEWVEKSRAAYEAIRHLPSHTA